MSDHGEMKARQMPTARQIVEITALAVVMAPVVQRLLAVYPDTEPPVEHVRNALQLVRALEQDLVGLPWEYSVEARKTMRAIEDRLAAAIEKLEPARVQ